MINYKEPRPEPTGLTMEEKWSQAYEGIFVDIDKTEQSDRFDTPDNIILGRD
jgi:hypothetical protein